MPRRDVDQLKKRLVEVWSDVQQTVVDAAIGEWKKRLRACVRANICFNFYAVCSLLGLFI